MLEMWYMKTQEGTDLGPLELHDLIKRISMAPDTLVRKVDEKKWLPAYAHPDLKPYLKPTKPRPIDENPKDDKEKTECSDVLVAGFSSRSPPPGLERWGVWIILILLLFTFLKKIVDK